MRKPADQTELDKGEVVSPKSDDGRWRLLAVAVVTLAAVLFFFRLGARALWSSEGRWAEIAREMILTSNYFWPTINGHLYYDKPLLSYWLVAGASYLTGGMNEAAARLPCALAGLAGVALLMALARRLYDLRTGVVAGFILATSFSFVFFSRHASADIETVTGELAALLLFMRCEDSRAGWWVVGLWFIMAVTSLTKGLLGFALPLLVIGTYSCLADGWGEFSRKLLGGRPTEGLRWLVARNRWLFNRYTIPAVALGMAVYLGPFALSQSQMHSGAGLHMVFRENVLRFFRPFDHRGPVYLYVYVIFALMAPWSVFLPAALAHAHGTLRGVGAPAKSDRFALVYFWATFIFFTLSGSRRSYYIIPILPAGALLVARMLIAPRESLSGAARQLKDIGYFVVAIAVVAGFAVLLPASMRPAGLAELPPSPERAAFALFWVAAVVVVIWALADRTSRKVAVSTSVVAYLSLSYLFLFALPAVEPYRSERSFANSVRERLGGDLSGLAVFNDQGPFFYLASSKPLPVYDNGALLAESVRRNQTRWVMVRERDLNALGVKGIVAIREETYPWERERERRNKQLLLKVGADLTAGQSR